MPSTPNIAPLSRASPNSRFSAICGAVLVARFRSVLL